MSSDAALFLRHQDYIGSQTVGMAALSECPSLLLPLDFSEHHVNQDLRCSNTAHPTSDAPQRACEQLVNGHFRVQDCALHLTTFDAITLSAFAIKVSHFLVLTFNQGYAVRAANPVTVGPSRNRVWSKAIPSKNPST